MKTLTMSKSNITLLAPVVSGEHEARVSEVQKGGGLAAFDCDQDAHPFVEGEAHHVTHRISSTSSRHRIVLPTMHRLGGTGACVIRQSEMAPAVQLSCDQQHPNDASDHLLDR